MNPRQRFERFLGCIIEELGDIDKDTPWQEIEPDWWVMMMTIQRQCIQYKKQLNSEG